MKGAHSRRRNAGAALAAAAIVGLPIASQQHAAASNTSDPAITAFPVSRPDVSQPLINDVVPGPNGWVWFSWSNGSFLSGIGTVNSHGVATFAPANGFGAIIHMTAGDGYVWTTDRRAGAISIGQWGPSGDEATTFPVAASGGLEGITWGPDGALWFAGGTSVDSCGLQGGFIGRMTTSGTVTTFPLPAGGGGYNGAEDIVPGPDGTLWFDLPKEAAVGRITTSGAISVFPLPGAQSQCDFASDQDLTEGLDQAMWVGSSWSGGVQRVAMDGTVTTYPASSNLFSITTGSDGSLWYTTAFGGAAVVRMSTSGQVTATWPLPPAYPAGAPLITNGADGFPWIGMQGVIERLDRTVSPSGPSATPTPVAYTPTAEPSASGTPFAGAVTTTPGPGFLDFGSPSPSASTGALASSPTHPSSGAGLGIVLGSAAAVVFLASGASAIVIRRRRSARITSAPTP